MTLIHELASSVVDKKLSGDLESMESWMRESAHRAETCKCPNCKKEAQSAREAYFQESQRQSGSRALSVRKPYV